MHRPQDVSHQVKIGEPLQIFGVTPVASSQLHKSAVSFWLFLRMCTLIINLNQNQLLQHGFELVPVQNIQVLVVNKCDLAKAEELSDLVTNVSSTL